MSVVIGLTGGIGSGKSTVARLFAELGAVVIDADAIVHELQAPGMPMLAELAAVFGDAILDAEGVLDRKALGEIVFRDDAKLAQLNGIVHPQVGAEFGRRLGDAIAAKTPLVVLDVPLLFEGRRTGGRGASSLAMQATVVVWVPIETQIERTMARDACTREEALQRMRAQIPLDEKRELADHVIDNSGSLDDTARQVRALFEGLTEAAA